MLTPHKIANSIKADFNQIGSHPVMIEFYKGLDYKNKIGRERDEAVINYLISKAQMYAEGWIRANMNATGELWNKSTEYDRLNGEQDKVFKMMNDTINRLILAIKEDLKPDQIEKLRELEKEIKKKLG